MLAGPYPVRPGLLFVSSAVALCLLTASGSAAKDNATRSNLAGCWSYRTRYRGQPYSATYCFAKNGTFYGSYTEGDDGTDFIGTWGLLPNKRIRIRLGDEFTSILCKLDFFKGRSQFELSACSNELLNETYRKSAP